MCSGVCTACGNVGVVCCSDSVDDILDRFLSWLDSGTSRSPSKKSSSATFMLDSVPVVIIVECIILGEVYQTITNSV